MSSITRFYHDLPKDPESVSTGHEIASTACSVVGMCVCVNIAALYKMTNKHSLDADNYYIYLYNRRTMGNRLCLL